MGREKKFEKHLNIFLFCCTMFLIILNAGCGDPMSAGKESYSFSFENDMGGWESKATDTVVGSQIIDWSVIRTTEKAYQDSTSLKLTLDNIGTSGKVWIENSFGAVPGTDYGVTVTYYLGTNDSGSSSSFTVITGASEESPLHADELIYWEGTNHNQGSGSGYVWLQKTYRFRVTAGVEGRVYVFIGVWGTMTAKRSYYFDKIKVKIDRLD